MLVKKTLKILREEVLEGGKIFSFQELLLRTVELFYIRG